MLMSYMQSQKFKAREKTIMVTPKSKLLVEQLLRRDSSYTKKDEIDGIEELRAFIKGLFDITDTFVDNYKQMNRE